MCERDSKRERDGKCELDGKRELDGKHERDDKWTGAGKRSVRSFQTRRLLD